jgi:hypothetical protein
MNEQTSLTGTAASAEAAEKAITPDTKVDRLLKDYPHLEPVLIKLSPAFAKLRNPILRKTVAKIANLRQAAQIGHISVGKLINTLRREAGLEVIASTETESPENDTEEPAWVKERTIRESFDAREMIEAGGHPLNKVLEDVEKLGDEEIYELITPFLPAPLIELAQNRGYDAWSKQEREDLVKTYFKRRG